jgi:hypothetical protein
MKKGISKVLAIITLCCFLTGSLFACHKPQCEVNGHTWSNGDYTTVATETSDGTITHTCKICKETATEVVPAGTKIVTRADLEQAVIDTAWAYCLKKEKVQYDSEHLTKVNGIYGGISRHSKDVSPEYGTSDTNLYTVCSAFVNNAYREGIGHPILMISIQPTVYT